MTELLTLFLTLMGLHAVGDYAWQGPALQKLKRLDDAPRPPRPGLHGLTAHGMVHGLLVGLATGSLVLGVLEAVIHAATDYLKVTGRIGHMTDQIIHWTCKLVWALVAIFVINTRSPLICAC